MSKRTKWLNIIGTAILIILAAIIIGACALAFLNLDDFSFSELFGETGDNAAVSGGDSGDSGDGSGSGDLGGLGGGSGSGGSGGGADSSDDEGDEGDEGDLGDLDGEGGSGGTEGEDGEGGSGSGDGDGSDTGDSGSGSSSSAGNLDTSGKIGGGSIGGGSGEPATAFVICSDTTGTLYLKLISFGDYDGSSWSQADEYGSLLYGGYSMSYLFGLALANGGASVSEVQIINYTSDYLLPYQLSTDGGDYDVQTSDVYYAGSSSSYSVNVYYYDYLSDGTDGLSLASAYTAAESIYSSYVYANYTEVQSSTLAALNDIIAEQNLYSSDVYTCILNIVNYVRNAATYNLEYDSALDDEEDIVISFLTEYKEGICQHYASAATLLLRACGIPARYTSGYVASTKSGEWTAVTTASAHAWVEVYIDGLGWITVDPTGSGSGSGSGGGEDDPSGGVEVDEKISIVVSSDSGKKTYNGSAQSLQTFWYTSGVLLEGHEVVFESVTWTDVGVYSNIFTATIVDGEGNDVTYMYDIEYNYGTFEIVKRTITLTTGSSSKTYDGTALVYNYYYFSGADLCEGHWSEVVISGSQTLRGESQNSVSSITIYDEDGSDVTKNYAIDLVYGTLTVT